METVGVRGQQPQRVRACARWPAPDVDLGRSESFSDPVESDFQTDTGYTIPHPVAFRRSCAIHKLLSDPAFGFAKRTRGHEVTRKSLPSCPRCGRCCARSPGTRGASCRRRRACRCPAAVCGSSCTRTACPCKRLGSGTCLGPSESVWVRHRVHGARSILAPPRFVLSSTGCTRVLCSAGGVPRAVLIRRVFAMQKQFVLLGPRATENRSRCWS